MLLGKEKTSKEGEKQRMGRDVEKLSLDLWERGEIRRRGVGFGTACLNSERENFGCQNPHRLSPLSFPLLIQDQSSSCALLEGGFPGKARGRRQLGGTLESPLLWKVTVGQTHCLGLPHLFLPICCLLEAEGESEGPED